MIETLSEQSLQRARSCPEEYTSLRSSWPCSPDVCRFLFGPELCALVASCLGSSGFLFNEQVRAPAACSVEQTVYLIDQKGTLNRAFPAVSLTESCAPTQYIVKPPKSTASAFSWHRDCAWLPEGCHSEYISVRAPHVPTQQCYR